MRTARVLDCTFYTGKPGPAGLLGTTYDKSVLPCLPGTSPVIMESRAWRPAGANGPADSFDRTRFLEWVGSLPDKAVAITDMERLWELARTEWEATTPAFKRLMVLAEAHLEANRRRPDVQLFPYGAESKPWYPLTQTSQDLKQAQDVADYADSIYERPLTALEGRSVRSLFAGIVLDFYCPGVPGSETDIGFRHSRYIIERVKLARQIGRPIIGFVYPRYVGKWASPGVPDQSTPRVGQKLPADTWLPMFDNAAKLCDRVCLWGGGEPWSDQSWWWGPTQAILARLPQVQEVAG